MARHQTSSLKGSENRIGTSAAHIYGGHRIALSGFLLLVYVHLSAGKEWRAAVVGNWRMEDRFQDTELDCTQAPVWQWHH